MEDWILPAVISVLLAAVFEQQSNPAARPGACSAQREATRRQSRSSCENIVHGIPLNFLHAGRGIAEGPICFRHL